MQTRFVIAVVLFLAWSAAMLCSGLYVGALAGRLGKANAAQKQATEQLDKVLAGLGEQNKRAEKLQKTLDRMPRPSNTIREVVRENPSGCVLAPAVVDSLREAIREGNGARKVP